jgi:4-amino-4-deoxy-L-arabinose transferase-like glycosyltransferase
MNNAYGRPYKVGKQLTISIHKVIKILTENGKKILLVLAIVITASIPPLFVVFDRWLNIPILLRIESDSLCNANFLCGLGLPDYFFVIFICTIVLLGIFIYLRKDAAFERLLNKSTSKYSSVTQKPSSVPYFQKLISQLLSIVSAVGFWLIFFFSLYKKTVPGWNLAAVILAYLFARLLADYDLTQVWKYAYRNNKWLIATILFHLSLILLLKDIYSVNGFQWLWGFVFVFATINLIRYRRFVKPIYWIISLALILFTFNLNDRVYTFIGDELSFFFAARDISQGQSFVTMGINLFHGTYVYEAHPYISSLIQAFFMKLLGVDSFGWRFSNIYLSAISIGLFYLFFKRFCPNRIALFSSILLAGSEYIMSFDKIGYNNLQALFVMGLVLAVSGYAVQSKRLFGFTLLGATMALCFYVFPAALYILPIPILLLIIYLPPFSKQNIRFWVMIIIPLWVCIFPLLLQMDYWQSKLSGTIFNTPGLIEAFQNLIIHFASNIIFAFYSFLYIPEQSHYVFSSYADPLTGMLILIGMAAFLSNFLRQKFVTFWIISFAIVVFLVGSSHDQTYPLTTRMFLLLPFFAFFAAVGLSWLKIKLREVSGNKRFPKISTRILIILVILLNTYQADVKSPEFYKGQFESSYLSTIENIEKKYTDDPKTFLLLTSEEWGIYASQALQEVYGIPREWDRIIELDAGQLNGSTKTTELIRQGTTFVIIRPGNDSTLQKTVEEQISALGEKLCPITDRPGGNLLFDLWYPEGFDYACKSD